LVFPVYLGAAGIGREEAIKEITEEFFEKSLIKRDSNQKRIPE